jgi:hypothetical protein
MFSLSSLIVLTVVIVELDAIVARQTRTPIKSRSPRPTRSRSGLQTFTRSSIASHSTVFGVSEKFSSSSGPFSFSEFSKSLSFVSTKIFSTIEPTISTVKNETNYFVMSVMFLTSESESEFVSESESVSESQESQLGVVIAVSVGVVYFVAILMIGFMIWRLKRRNRSNSALNPIHIGLKLELELCD